MDELTSHCPVTDNTVVFDPLSGENGQGAIPPESLRAALKLKDGRRMQDFEPLHPIGIGGLGAVFSGFEPGLDREIALKVMRPAFRGQPERVAGFIREARLTAKIDHPNIVPVHRLEVLEDAGVVFSMRKIAGETLRSILTKLSEGDEEYLHEYSLRRLLGIFISACQGVAYAHRRGIIHCDLKPGNVMIGDYGEVLVMDWGLARSCDKDDLASIPELNLPPEDSTPRIPAGTPAFMAPELICTPPKRGLLHRKNQEADRYPLENDELTDIYALGETLYCILTLKNSAFNAKKPVAELFRDIASARFRRPRRAASRYRRVPRELEAICLKAMNPLRRERYQTVLALIRDVRSYLDNYPVEAAKTLPLRRIYKFICRHPTIPAVLTAAAVTWGTYTLYQQFSAAAQAKEDLSQAQNLFQIGQKNRKALQNAANAIQHGAAGNRSTVFFMRQYLREAAAMESSCKTAMELFARSGKYGLRDELSCRMATAILRDLAIYHVRSGNEPALRNFLAQARLNWTGWYYRARNSDATFRHIIGLLQSSQGILGIRRPENAAGYSVRIFSNGKPVAFYEEDRSEKKFSAVLSKPEMMIPLPAGKYSVMLTDERNKLSFQVPISVTAAGARDLSVPETLCNIPGMIYVPAGKFSENEPGEFTRLHELALGDFYIGKHEVTRKEYYQFWKTLPEGRMKQNMIPVWRTARNRIQHLWDEKGRSLVPYRSDVPVTGISSHAAALYCRNFGKRYGMTGRLPNRYQWARAAGGKNGEFVWGDHYSPGDAHLADGIKVKNSAVHPGSYRKDTSSFGVQDMAGNVREFLSDDLHAGKLSAAAGGSYLTSPELARTGVIHYVNESENDVGFRVVLLHPEKAKNKTKKH